MGSFVIQYYLGVYMRVDITIGLSQNTRVHRIPKKERKVTS